MIKTQISQKTNLAKITIIMSILLVIFSSLGSNPQMISHQILKTSSGLDVVQGSIVISSDSDFPFYASEGDGTSLNPYIIQDYVINVSGTSDVGLVVEVTTAHFVVRNCTIFGNPDGVSLAFESIASGTGTAENNTIIGGRRCITMGYSHGVKIIGNKLSNPVQSCLEMWRSNGTIVVNNTLERTTRDYSPGVVVTENKNVILFGNSIQTFDTGISISDTENLLVYNNIIDNCTTGIWLTKCVDSNFLNNTISDCVENSMLYGPNDGSQHNWIYENHFNEAAIYLTTGNYNQKIFHNVFEGSFGVHDSGLDNVWYNIDLMEGNNWSNWVGSGAYNIPGTAGSQDIYPNSTSSAFMDTDLDGLTDNAENCTFGTTWNNNDTDNDGLLDGSEIFDYLTNPLSNDTDGDLMTDGWELEYGLNPLVNDALVDTDQDGASNLDEFNNNIDPIDEDTDGDGIFDGWELDYGYNPLVNDSSNDSDSDGASILEEFTYDCDPTLNDTDLDGLLDGEEIHTYQTDPTNSDTDGDSFSDGEEVEKGSDPLDIEDTPFLIPGYSTLLIILFSFAALVLIYRKINLR